MPKRMIDTELWDDAKIVENFTAEDTYFWLYLLSSPHGTICGVVKCSPITIGREMKYSTDCIKNLIERFETYHNLIKYNRENNEILIYNWAKYNWTNSPLMQKALENSLKTIKTEEFKKYIIDVAKNNRKT